MEVRKQVGHTGGRLDWILQTGGLQTGSIGCTYAECMIHILIYL